MLMLGNLEELQRLNIIHRLDEGVVRWNHGHLITRLLEQEVAAWARHLVGRRVLDVGAGFGHATRELRRQGFDVTPIDIDPVSIALAHELTGVVVLPMSVYEFGYHGSVDVMVMRDVAAHLDTHRWIEQAMTLGIQEIVIVDSNLRNPLLRASRSLARHREYNDRAVDSYVGGLTNEGFDTVHSARCHFVAWPLSGGFLRRQIVPRIDRVERIVLAVDRTAERLLGRTPAARVLAWREVIVFRRRPPHR
jgi:SAM-dependent methyltransferase